MIRREACPRCGRDIEVTTEPDEVARGNLCAPRRPTRFPWRAGWRGRLLRLHSPSAHPFGQCWCQRHPRCEL